MAESLTVREHNGTWCVSTEDNTDIVSFAGPGARERAERQRRELLDLLESQPILPSSGAVRSPRRS